MDDVKILTRSDGTKALLHPTIRHDFYRFTLDDGSTITVVHEGDHITVVARDSLSVIPERPSKVRITNNS